MVLGSVGGETLATEISLLWSHGLDRRERSLPHWSTSSSSNPPKALDRLSRSRRVNSPRSETKAITLLNNIVTTACQPSWELFCLYNIISSPQESSESYGHHLPWMDEESEVQRAWVAMPTQLTGGEGETSSGPLGSPDFPLSLTARRAAVCVIPQRPWGGGIAVSPTSFLSHRSLSTWSSRKHFSCLFCHRSQSKTLRFWDCLLAALLRLKGRKAWKRRVERGEGGGWAALKGGEFGGAAVLGDLMLPDKLKLVFLRVPDLPGAIPALRMPSLNGDNRAFNNSNPWRSCSAFALAKPNAHSKLIYSNLWKEPWDIKEEHHQCLKVNTFNCGPWETSQNHVLVWARKCLRPHNQKPSECALCVLRRQVSLALAYVSMHLKIASWSTLPVALLLGSSLKCVLDLCP